MEQGPGHKLAEIRERHHVRQADLARALNMSRQQLSNIEAGRREISLTDLKRAARELGVATVDLLLPEDVPDYPNSEEVTILKELRSFDGYDAHALLGAVRGVLFAFDQVRHAIERPRGLAGDPKLTSRLAATWNDLSEDQRGTALAMLDHAREFRRD